MTWLFRHESSKIPITKFDQVNNSKLTIEFNSNKQTKHAKNKKYLKT